MCLALPTLPLRVQCVYNIKIHASEALCNVASTEMHPCDSLRVYVYIPLHGGHVHVTSLFYSLLFAKKVRIESGGAHVSVLPLYTVNYIANDASLMLVVWSLL